jgi:hypothetical protein
VIEPVGTGVLCCLDIDVGEEEPSANHKKSICELAFSAKFYRGGP